MKIKPGKIQLFCQIDMYWDEFRYFVIKLNTPTATSMAMKVTNGLSGVMGVRVSDKSIGITPGLDLTIATCYVSKHANNMI